MFVPVWRPSLAMLIHLQHDRSQKSPGASWHWHPGEVARVGLDIELEFAWPALHNEVTPFEARVGLPAVKKSAKRDIQ